MTNEGSRQNNIHNGKFLVTDFTDDEQKVHNVKACVPERTGKIRSKNYHWGYPLPSCAVYVMTRCVKGQNPLCRL